MVTRWCARADAMKSLYLHYVQIRSTLLELSIDSTQNLMTRQEAKNLLKIMNDFETALMTVIWYTILNRFNATNVSLQKPNIDILNVIKLYDTLSDYISKTRENFDEMENHAKKLVDVYTYALEKKRVRKRKQMFDETNTPEVELSARDKFRSQTFYVIIDCLTMEIKKRQSAYSKIKELFGFFTEFNKLSIGELREQCTNLVNSYPNDLEIDFVDEFLQFSSMIATKNEDTVNIERMMEHLADGGPFLGSYPNVRIALRIFLSLPATNCEGERSFSTLARIKNHLRNSIGQNRVSTMALMSIESKLLREISFDDIINDFADKKSRKKIL